MCENCYTCSGGGLSSSFYPANHQVTSQPSKPQSADSCHRRLRSGCKMAATQHHNHQNSFCYSRTMLTYSYCALMTLLLCLISSVQVDAAPQSGSSSSSSSSHSRRVKEIFTTYACEGSEMKLTCPADTAIHLVRANYGRFSISICNDGGRFDWSVNCMSYRSFLIMQDRCGKSSNCSVVVSSTLFGDPCPGTQKYLEVQYHCKKPEPPATTRVASSAEVVASAGQDLSMKSPSVVLTTDDKTGPAAASAEDNSNSDDVKTTARPQLPPTGLADKFPPKFQPRPAGSGGPVVGVDQQHTSPARLPPVRLPTNMGDTSSSVGGIKDFGYWPAGGGRMPTHGVGMDPQILSTTSHQQGGGGGVGSSDDLMETSNSVNGSPDYPTAGNGNQNQNGGGGYDQAYDNYAGEFDSRLYGGGSNNGLMHPQTTSMSGTTRQDSASSATTSSVISLSSFLYLLFIPPVVFVVCILVKCHHQHGSEAHSAGSGPKSISSASSNSSNGQTDLHFGSSHHPLHNHGAPASQCALTRWGDWIAARLFKGASSGGGPTTGPVLNATLHHHHHMNMNMNHQDSAGPLPTKLIGLTTGPPTAGMMHRPGMNHLGNQSGENWAYGIRPLVPPPISLDGKGNQSSASPNQYGCSTDVSQTTNTSSVSSGVSNSGNGKLVCPLTPTMRDDLLSSANQANRTTGPLLVNPIKDSDLLESSLDPNQETCSSSSNNSHITSLHHNMHQIQSQQGGVTIDEIAAATADSRSLADFEARLHQLRSSSLMRGSQTNIANTVYRQHQPPGQYHHQAQTMQQSQQQNNFNNLTPSRLPAQDHRRRPFINHSSNNPMWDAYGYGFNTSLVRAINEHGVSPALMAAAAAAAQSQNPNGVVPQSYIDHIYMSIDKDSSNGNIYSATRI